MGRSREPYLYEMYDFQDTVCQKFPLTPLGLTFSVKKLSVVVHEMR